MFIDVISDMNVVNTSHWSSYAFYNFFNFAEAIKTRQYIAESQKYFAEACKYPWGYYYVWDMSPKRLDIEVRYTLYAVIKDIAKTRSMAERIWVPKEVVREKVIEKVRELYKKQGGDRRYGRNSILAVESHIRKFLAARHILIFSDLPWWKLVEAHKLFTSEAAALATIDYMVADNSSIFTEKDDAFIIWYV